MHVELAGREFARQSVPEERVSYPSDTQWNPSGHANWVLYNADDSHAPDVHPHLWYRETRETFRVEFGRGDLQRTQWSPDGRYLAVLSGWLVSDHPVVDFDHVLYVQEVLDGELGSHWQIDAVSKSLDGEPWYLEWQP
jgi:hypothetical protein